MCKRKSWMSKVREKTVGAGGAPQGPHTAGGPRTRILSPAGVISPAPAHFVQTPSSRLLSDRALVELPG